MIGFLIALGAVWFMKHFTFNTSGFDAAFVLGVAVLAYALPTLVGGNGYLSAYIVGTVSYTHLDVYKRQGKSYYRY